MIFEKVSIKILCFLFSLCSGNTEMYHAYVVRSEINFCSITTLYTKHKRIIVQKALKVLLN